MVISEAWKDTWVINDMENQSGGVRMDKSVWK
jgi:hypothetical protein